jgi:hypothetical protein
MSAAEGKGFSIGEWVIIFGLAAIAVALTEISGLSSKWEDATVYTVVLFTVVVLALRPAWGRRAFWEGLLAIFVLHVLAVIVLEQSLPAVAKGFHGVPMTIAGMAEAVLIGGVLWKRSMRSKG